MNKKKTIILLTSVLVAIVLFLFFTNKNNKDKLSKKIETEEKIENNEKKEETKIEKYIDLKDEDYKNLISGEFNKTQLEFLLGFLQNNHIKFSSPSELISFFSAMSSKENNPVLNNKGYKNDKSNFSLKEINRIISLFSDKQFTNDDSNNAVVISENDDNFAFSPATIPYGANVSIKEAVYNESKKDLKILFDFESVFHNPGGKKDVTKKQYIANLSTGKNGKFIISNLEDTNTDKTLKAILNGELNENTVTDNSNSNSKNSNLKAQYKKVIDSFKNNDGKYGSIDDKLEDYKYFLMDLNNDNTKELIIATQFKDGKFILSVAKIFGYDEKNIVEFTNDHFNQIIGNSFFISKDSKNLYTNEFSPGTGIINIYKISVDYSSSKLLKENFKEFRIDDDKEKSFFEENKKLETIPLTTELNLD